jgi:hypothetical protein
MSGDEKANLEHHAVQSFIKLYNQTHRRKLTFLQLGHPPMPDAICRLGRRDLGIEVAHCYGSWDDAALRLGHRLASQIPKIAQQARRTTPLDVRVLSTLNEVLTKKSTREYDFGPVWLVVRNAFSAWSARDYRRRQDDIMLPTTTPFGQIWLVCDENSVGPQGLLRLA